MLILLSHVSSERGAIFDGAAAEDAKLWLLVDYMNDGYVKMNYPDTTHAAWQHSAVLARAFHARTRLPVHVCSLLAVVRWPFGRVCVCSCVSGAKKAEEGHNSHQCPKIVSRVSSRLL